MVNIQANPANIRKHIIVLRLPDLQGKEYPDKERNQVLQYILNPPTKHQLKHTVTQVIHLS